MAGSIPPTIRAELEQAVRHLRTALPIAKHDLREASDPDERVFLRTLVDDIAGCVFRLERRLYPGRT